MILMSFTGDKVIAAVEGLKEGTPRAIMRALNRAIGAARTVETRAIAADTGLKQADVRAVIPMKLATLNRLQASISAPTKRIPLMDFKARQTRGGVSYKLGNGKGNIDSAFIATMANGHVGVFTRTPGRFMQQQKSTWKVKREAIQEKFGPSIGHVFRKYVPDAQARAEEIFATNFKHETEGAWNGTPVPSGDGADSVGAS